MNQQLRPALAVFLLMTLVTGVAYPALVTVVAQVALPHEAQGSLIRRDGRIVGSTLIGQPFQSEKYFWSRPSATTPAFNGAASSGSNLGPTNPALVDAVAARLQALRQAGRPEHHPIPVDLVTTSASGLDPHLSPASAELQVSRVARTRGLNDDQVRKLVRQHTLPRTFGILGEPRVNVLELNLALDVAR